MSTREEWLTTALGMVRRHLLETAVIVVPETTRVSCGFPGQANIRRAIGQCWHAESSADGHHEIFISPMLAEPLLVLATLVHEAIHACLPVSAGHKAPFKKAMLEAGLEGKATSTNATARLNAIMASWIETLGGYPHATLTLGSRKKQTTRLVKCACAGCGYTVRTTQKWIDFSGATLCPTEACDGERMTVEVVETEDES